MFDRVLKTNSTSAKIESHLGITTKLKRDIKKFDQPDHYYNMTSTVQII